MKQYKQGKKADFKVSIGVGSSQSASSSETTQITHQGSTPNAGQVNSLPQMAILRFSAQLFKRREKVSLDAAKSLQLTSVQDIEHQRSQNSNSAAGVLEYLLVSMVAAQVLVLKAQSKKAKGMKTVISGFNVTPQFKVSCTVTQWRRYRLKRCGRYSDKLNVEVGTPVIESRQDS